MIRRLTLCTVTALLLGSLFTVPVVADESGTTSPGEEGRRRVVGVEISNRIVEDGDPINSIWAPQGTVFGGPAGQSTVPNGAANSDVRADVRTSSRMPVVTWLRELLRLVGHRDR